MYIDNVDGESIVDDKRSKIGHLASGVPGSVDGMVKIYEKFGTINWDELIDPSIKVARNGFMVTKKQARGLNNVKESLLSANDHSLSFVKETDWEEGNLLVQENLALTLEEIKSSKRDLFKPVLPETLSMSSSSSAKSTVFVSSSIYIEIGSTGLRTFR